jgi:hypothetical protein
VGSIDGHEPGQFGRLQFIRLYDLINIGVVRACDLSAGQQAMRIQVFGC